MSDNVKKYTFERVVCPKCGKAYAISKGSTASFHCPGKNCHEMVNAKASAKTADAPSKRQE